MWIVQLALRRPYTFVVASLLVLLLGGLAAWRMPKDILPEIDIPIVTTVWTYGGLLAQDMERQITTFADFALNNNVNDVRAIKSETVAGLATIRISFQPGANSPLIIRCNAATAGRNGSPGR